MDVKKFYTTQDDLGNSLKLIIDSYLENEISNDNLIDIINEIINLNKDIYWSNFVNNEIAARVRGKLGIKRIDIISKVLNLKEDSYDNFNS